MKQGVKFDAFGESCYQRYQGDPNSTASTKTGWQSTFSGLATKLSSAEAVRGGVRAYVEREINDVVFGLSGNQGIGTFNWEPTTQGDWNTGHRSVAAHGKHVHGPAGRGALRPDEDGTTPAACDAIGTCTHALCHGEVRS